ncbi:uberolysin/carnocyclin family circular bacteriocin [Glycomyces harbinensis]|uniref:Circular bacteriocin, circularin A/uberolysin family n=1 Tax=Glycomyces harbinensis TaxID=58114 RepID=A0A1G7B1T2_9ACTN|nr:uberolysin/carnocyclin family circular bacteriocin [Glycomyces harbinensis]SDE20981.1 circular bacteriocin, circularin A/uberolysin family [Glycomyces harbinensis]
MQLKKILGGAAAGALGVAGLLTAGLALAWVAGSLGISAAAASQIVNAIMVGGTALAIVIAIFGGGIISAIAFTVRAIVARVGTAHAIA